MSKVGQSNCGASRAVDIDLDLSVALSSPPSTLHVLIYVSGTDIKPPKYASCIF